MQHSAHADEGRFLRGAGMGGAECHGNGRMLLATLLTLFNITATIASLVEVTPPITTAINPAEVDAVRSQAEAGGPEAQYKMGVYEEIANHNFAAAARWYKLGAAGGHPEAQNRLGIFCRRGKGVQADNAEAVRWYRLAAEQGDPYAQCNLGGCYEEGAGYRWTRVALCPGTEIGQARMLRRAVQSRRMLWNRCRRLS